MFVHLSVPLAYRKPPEAACIVAAIHFGLTISRTDILVTGPPTHSLGGPD